jgi:hypothetical protein
MPDRPQLRDIGFRPLPVLNWAADQQGTSIAALIDYVSDEARQAIVWYLRKKQEKRIGARCSRLFAIVATSLAAIIPLVSQIDPTHFPPALASIALVFAAAAIALDRFFGYSSAWMRYLATESQIRRSLHGFHMQIEARRAELGGREPADEDIQYFVSHCTDFLLGLDDLVRDETAMWSTELRSILREMEAAARGHAQDQRSAEIKLTVTNGDQVAGGWSAAVDNAGSETYTGRTTTLRNISPGRHIVQVRGMSGGQQKTARKTITVGAGETGSLELTLG